MAAQSSKVETQDSGSYVKEQAVTLPRSNGSHLCFLGLASSLCFCSVISVSRCLGSWSLLLTLCRWGGGSMGFDCSTGQCCQG